MVKFSSVHHLSLYFTGTERTDKIKLYYIGLKGEWTPSHHHGVTICTYELRPQMSDHPKGHNEDINRTVSWFYNRKLIEDVLCINKENNFKI